MGVIERSWAGRLILPGVNRIIPIIEDSAVEMSFGTGAVKVTPAHDPTDYEIGNRHGMTPINILNRDGTLNDNAGPYAGLDRYVARERLLEDLASQGLLTKTEELPDSVGHCDRCHTIVEPLISEQWFVRIATLAKAASDAVRDGRIRFVPERFSRVYDNWMDNIRDWCISRQLWWGHRIPSGTAAIAVGEWLPSRPRRLAPSAATSWSRTPMCSTPGSAAACGRSALWGGLMTPTTCVASTRPA